MERCAALIEKLQQDLKNNATPEQLLVTLQILQKELIAKTTPSPYKKSLKVSVVMPNLFQHYPDQNTLPVTDAVENEMDKISEPITPALCIEDNILIQNNHEPALEVHKLVLIDETEDDEEEDDYANIPVVAQQNIPEKEQPSFVKEQDEIHSKILFTNDDYEHPSLEMPLKDLKKGIGVNDRFLFIKELFRGDEVMYERSIKTINSFNIYPEAQYWIERELKIKLGWDDNNEIIQIFYNLVRRRFSAI